MLTMVEEAEVAEAVVAEDGAMTEGPVAVGEEAAKMKETQTKHLMSQIQTKTQKI